MLEERLDERISSAVVPKVRATSSIIFSMVIGAGWSLLIISLIAACAVLILGGAPSSKQ